MNYPHWVTDPGLTPAEREKMRITYLLRLAALNHNPEASLPTLASSIGVSRESFYAPMREGRVTVLLATAIEHAVGANVVSRKDLCAEISTTTM